jgi:hypothetical protein
MIKGITQGAGLFVSNGNPMNPYISPGSISAGMMRYNPNSNNIEVYDGINWITLSGGYVQVGLDGPTLEAVEWVKRKMEQEKRLEELTKKHPSVADAVATLAHAQEQLDIVTALVQQ